MSRPGSIFLLLAVVLVVATPADAKEGAGHQGFGQMHATINGADHLSAGERASLHEAVGHAADAQVSAHQADLLQGQLDGESDPAKQAELQRQIEELRQGAAKSADAAGKAMADSQRTQVGDTISNLISQVNTIISNSVHGH